MQFAEQEIVNLLAKQQNGLKIRSPTFAEAVRAFQLHDEKELAAEVVSKRTVLMHNHYIHIGMEYLKEKFPAGIRTRLTEIDGKRDFEDYRDWRVKRRKVTWETVKAELIGIRMVFQFAKENRLCDDRSIPEWDFKTELPRRRRMEDGDYSKVLTCMKSWLKKAQGHVDTYNRHLLQHIFLLISATGMRTGEVFGLKNKDIQTISSDKLEAVIRIRAETTKVRKERRITVNPSFGGRKKDATPINYLIRWLDQYQIHKEPEDFVFSLHTKGGMNATYPFYRSYTSLREELKEVGMEWWDAYHNRHYFITQAIRAGHPLSMIAVSCGNSIQVIERTYSHLFSEQVTREMGKIRVVRSNDGGHEVITN